MKKITNLWMCQLIVIGIFLLFTVRCNKNDDDKNDPTTITDIDGNLYHTVTIGAQIWMVENLSVTRYRNGDSILNISGLSPWKELTSGAYYNADKFHSNYTNTYGRIYNWFAVNDKRHIAPEGWHIPTDNEWETLINHLGGDSIAGGKLKEGGLNHWLDPNAGATNESGFTALPGGHYTPFGSAWGLGGMGSFGYWWTYTDDHIPGMSKQLMVNSNLILTHTVYKGEGFSVRCLKD